MDPASAAHPGDWWGSWILYVSHSTKTDCFWGRYTIKREGQHWEREDITVSIVSAPTVSG